MSINNLNTYLNVRDAHLRVVSGNVYAQAMNIGGINVETAHGLQSVSNTGNATSLTLEFANVTTGFVTTANAQIGRDLIVTGNATVSTDLTVSANATVTDTLTVSEHLLASKEATVTGNLHVTTIMSDSNVVAEYTGPHDRPLRKYPEVAFPLQGSSESAASGATTFTYKSYTVTSNSVYSGANYKISNAFDGTATSWSGNLGDYDSNGDVASGRTANYLQIQLPNAIKLENIKIISEANYEYANGPRNITLYGSNNGSDWVTLKTETDLPLNGGTTNPDPQTAFVHVNTTTKYLYYKLEISKIWISSGGATYARIGEWELYGYEEGSGSLDTTLKSVYNVPATTGTQLEVYYDGQDYTQASDFTGSDGVIDKAGGDQDGTASSGVSFDSTYKAFTFDGTANGKIVGTHNLSGASPVLTMSFWMKRTAVVGTGWNYVATIGTSTTGEMIGLTINPSSQFNFSNYGDGTLSAEPILLNQWYHVTLVTNGESAFNSTNFKMYINGKEPVLSSHGGGNTTTLTGTQLTLGTNTNSAEAFNGSIANFRLYSKALNAEQIQELYDYQKDYFLGSKSQLTIYKGHLGVGVTEPSGQLELAGDERIQEYPPRAITVLNYHTDIEGHGEFEFYASTTNYAGDTAWDFTKAFENTAASTVGWHGYGLVSTPGMYQAVLQYAPAVTSGDDVRKTSLIDGSIVYGEWIEMRSPYAINITRLATAPRINYGNSRGIGKFALLGSNNGIDWEYAGNGAIASYNPSSSTDAGGYGTYGSETIARVSTNSNGRYYTHHRLVVTHIMGHRAATGHPNYNQTGSEVVNVSYLRFYGTPGHTTLDKGSLTLGRSLDVPRVSRYDVDTETPRPEKLLVDFDTTVNSSPTDISGRGNHGTFYNGASYSPADKAFNFPNDVNTASQNVKINTVSPISINTDIDISFSVWVKVDTASTTGWRAIWEIGNRSGNAHFGLYIPGSTASTDRGPNQFSFETWSQGFYPTGDTVEANRWYHVVCTYNKDTRTKKLYVDGVYKNGGTITTGAYSSGIVNPPLTIGTNLSDGEGWAGHVSNFKVYKDAILEPSEVRKLYNLGRTGRSMVISDTAVGIGKAPEAQLDVRGDLRVGGRLLASVPYYSARQRDTQSYVFDESIVYDQYVYTNYPGSFVANSATDGYYKPPMNGMYHVHMECIASGSGNIHIQRLTNGTVDISHDDRHFNYPHGGWMSTGADALIPITNHTTQTIRIYHSGSSGNGLWQYATYHGSAFFLWVSDIPERRQHHVA